MIRVFDEAGNVIETPEHVGDFKESSAHLCPAALLIVQLRGLSRRAEGEELRSVEAGSKNSRRPSAGSELQDIPVRSRI